MPHRAYMAKLKLDAEELDRRRRYFEITDEDLRRLASLRGFAEKWNQTIVEDLYQLILGHQESRRFFESDTTISHVKQAQREYFLQLFTDKLDLAYVEDRLRVGVTHERIGMPPKLYLGAYGHYLRVILARLMEELSDSKQIWEAYNSIQKRVRFDESLAIDTYIAAHLDSIARHQAAIRELSTPVIKIRDRILLLPLIGTVDTRRAEQLMETVLLKVVEEQARVMIIDIAGVAVVDTRVAEHLLKTTAAVRLLGAQTILTGITPTVAKTIINAGMDISAMHTLSRLADGLELADELIRGTHAAPALEKRSS